nr:putative lipid II flippase FtsW [Kineosphaera limosa]
MTSTPRPRERRREDEPVAGIPPQEHPIWARLESPLSTYYLLIAVVAALLLIGLVMVLSASSVAAVQARGDAFVTFRRQLVFAVIGVVGAVVASRMSVRTWRSLAIPMLLGALCLQALVFTPLGVNVLGNRNWLTLGPIQIQPSEIGKLALVVYGASVLATKRRLLGQWRHAIVPLVFPAGALVVGLVLLGHDLGTALVLLATLAGLLWASGVSGRLFVLAGGAAAVGVTAMVLVSGNRMHRLNTWLGCEEVHQCWQSQHGLYALADGGLSGLGLGASREKWLWLPEPHNDFIFAIIGEELGIGGTLTVLVLFALLTLACYRIVMRTDDPFVRVATAGVMAWIISQAMINIGSVIGLLPVIGVPLPLVSSGGSALVMTLAALGMVISFARNEPACKRALDARPRVMLRSLSVFPAGRGRR